MSRALHGEGRQARGVTALHALSISVVVVGCAAPAPPVAANDTSADAGVTPTVAPTSVVALPDAGEDSAQDAAASQPDATVVVPGVPAWSTHPFAGLPEERVTGREIVVRIEVVRRYTKGAKRMTSPLVLSIPALGKQQSIFDDYVATPRCKVTASPTRGAVFVDCMGMDGAVMLRAFQERDELVVEVVGRGDAPPESFNPRFALPAGSRVRFVTRFPKPAQPTTTSDGPSSL
jgi:hypothetical protein